MKLKKKNCLIVLIILLLIILEVVNPFELIATNSIKKLNYSNDSSKKIISLGLKEQVLEHGYSEFIDKNVFSSDFDINRFDTYKQLNYSSNLNNLVIINQIIDKGYNIEEINCILKTGDNDSASDFIKKEKYEYIVDFLNFDYANLKNLDRYVDYQMKTLSNYKETVLSVELGLDKEVYTDYNIINKFEYNMLVNKYNQLPKDFTPDELVKVDSNYSVNDDNYANKTMLDNFYKMADDLKKELGLSIYIGSSYRSYEDQEEVYEQYLKAYGKNYVKKYVAYPGFSEHQTGLALDLKAESGNTFANTKESKWLIQNAHKYGFIQRYISKKENITGYQSEPWHYRYVGVEIATHIKENNLSFDEYYVMFLNK